MKTNFVENRPVQELERGLADDFGQLFYKHWKDNNGAMPDEESVIAKHIEKFVILNTIENTEDSPEILSVGSDTLLAELIPQTADPRLSSARTEIEPGYRRFVRQSYVRASAGEARYDVIGSNYLLPGGIEWLKIERILLPYTSPTGLRWIFCYSILREKKLSKNQPGQLIEKECSPLPIDPDQLWMARFSI
jgi:hypothetical protein